MAKELGVVVVGLGLAGKARVRDLQQHVIGEDVVLRGVISRRKNVECDAPLLTWDEAMAREDVNAVIICTENDTHEDYIRECLEHNKHVLVEYPLALSDQAGKEVYKLAGQKGLVLHHEDIALLLTNNIEFHSDVKKKQEQTSLSEGKIHMTANFPRSWIEDPKHNGFLSFAAFSRLETLIFVCGKLTVKEAMFTDQDDHQTLTCTLLTADGKPFTWVEERYQDATRASTLEMKFADGTILKRGPPSFTTTGRRGLFAQDLAIFVMTVQGERKKEDVEADRNRVIHGLELAEEIKKLAMKGQLLNLSNETF